MCPKKLSQMFEFITHDISHGNNSKHYKQHVLK